MQFLTCVSLFLAVAFAEPTHICIQSSIAGGHLAAKGQFPFQVGLFTYISYTSQIKEKLLCGGSIISDRFILTAAHCLISGDFLEVIIDELEIFKQNVSVIRVDMEHIIIHENYSARTIANDIALIELPEKLTFSENIKPINLPRKSQKDETYFITEGWITGWGSTGNGDLHSEHLQYGCRFILSDLSCSMWYGNVYKKDMQICVDGSDAISTCPGDSGGPLSILEEDGSWTIVGITSIGHSSCIFGFPTVSTRVTKYLDWISKKTGIVLRD